MRFRTGNDIPHSVGADFLIKMDGKFGLVLHGKILQKGGGCVLEGDECIKRVTFVKSHSTIAARQGEC